MNFGSMSGEEDHRPTTSEYLPCPGQDREFSPFYIDFNVIRKGVVARRIGGAVNFDILG
jgi:hypothetical protein